MTRVKRGNIARKKHKKTLKITEGFRGSSSVLFRTANQQKMKALRFSYRDRNQRKRQFRTVWITRMNAAVRFYGVNYNEFLHGLKIREISGINLFLFSEVGFEFVHFLKILLYYYKYL